MYYLNNNYINEGFIGEKLAKKRENEYKEHVAKMKSDAKEQYDEDNVKKGNVYRDVNNYYSEKDSDLRDRINNLNALKQINDKNIPKYESWRDRERRKELVRGIDRELAYRKKDIDKNQEKWNTGIKRVKDYFKKRENNRQKHIENTENLLNKRVEATKNRSDLSYAKSYLKQGIRKLNRSKLGKTINNFGNKLGYKGKTINKKIKLREDVELYRYYREMV